MEGYSLAGWEASFPPPEISTLVQSCLLGGSVTFPHEVFLYATLLCVQPRSLEKLLGLLPGTFSSSGTLTLFGAAEVSSLVSRRWDLLIYEPPSGCVVVCLRAAVPSDVCGEAEALLLLFQGDSC